MLNVVIVGNGLRANNLYIPLINKLSILNLYGVCGFSFDKAKQTADLYNIKAYKNIEEILSDSRIDIIICCASWTENSTLYQKIAKGNIPALLETPLGHSTESIKKTYTSLKKGKAYVDICEQYHMRPIEQLKLKLIKSGVFGKIVYTFCNGVGHEYHGASIIRSYLGFEDKVKNICAMQKDMPYFDHSSHKNMFFPGERVQNAILEFESGALGQFHWSWLSYSSPIRANRISGFYGTRGSCFGENCMVFINKTSNPEAVLFQRNTNVVDGIEVLHEIVAYIKDKVVARWINPVPGIILNEDEMAACNFLINICKASIDKSVVPLYSIEQAYQDHLLIEKMNKCLLY